MDPCLEPTLVVLVVGLVWILVSTYGTEPPKEAANGRSGVSYVFKSG